MEKKKEKFRNSIGIFEDKVIQKSHIFDRKLLKFDHSAKKETLKDMVFYRDMAEHQRNRLDVM